MRRRLGFSLLGVAVLGALGSLAGCGRGFFFMEQREAWRHDAEVSCLKSGAVKESAARVRVNPIDGPGMCGADFPLRVSALGDSGATAYSDEIRPPGSIPRSGAAQPRWPVSQPSPPPAQVYAPAPAYPAQRGSDAYEPPPGSENYLRTPEPYYAPPPPASRAAPAGPLPLYAPGVAAPVESSTRYNYPPQPSGGSVVRSYPPDRPIYDAPPSYPASRPLTQQPLPALGPARATPIATTRPVEVTPNATLACPIVSALDQWISGSVQPAAMRWFGQPVVEIKQISAYSCRGMNGQVGAKISEHAFGNALDIAAFTLADGRKIVVRTAWHGAPEEQGFLRDVQGAACQQFNTVLAPGSNQFHYDHIHVDLMRRNSGHQICQPAAMSGEVAAARAAQQKGYARRGDPGITGSITSKRANTPVEDDDHQWIKTDTAASVAPRPTARSRD